MATLRSMEMKSPVHAAVIDSLRNIQRYSGAAADLIVAGQWEDVQLRCDWIERTAVQMRKDLSRLTFPSPSPR